MLEKIIKASPNHGDRKGRMPDAIVLHTTCMESGEAALARLCDPASQVSAHYLIFEGGLIYELVPEARRAWHAGVSYWDAEKDMNSVSIGIELAHKGPDGGMPPFPQAQITALIALCHDILTRYKIPQTRILAHSDIAPDRKNDPGEIFPWAFLAEQGIGHYAPPHPIVEGPRYGKGAHGERVEALQSMLAIYGYGITVTSLYGLKTLAAVKAFQRHFRPELVDGIADVSTIETLRMLLKTRPRD